MKIGLVQSHHNELYDFLNPIFVLNYTECLDLRTEQFNQNLALLQEAVGQGYDLLVTTECINYIRTEAQAKVTDKSLYPPLENPQTAALADVARLTNAWLVAGYAYQENSIVSNAALIFDRKGILRGVYSKTHLAGDESIVFTPGNMLYVQDADFGRFGVCICFDLQFPEVARTLALRGAQLIVCPTWGWEANWYGRARAYENGIFTAAAMAVPGWGDIEAPRSPSSVINPDGTMAVCGPTNQATLVACEIDLSQTRRYRDIRLKARRPELYC